MRKWLTTCKQDGRRMSSILFIYIDWRNSFIAPGLVQLGRG